MSRPTDSLVFSSSTAYLGTDAVDDENNRTSALSKDSPSHAICYSIGCDNPATKIVKIPLNQSVSCLIHVCDNCLPRYTIAKDIHESNRLCRYQLQDNEEQKE
jgi:hypothetical protein